MERFYLRSSIKEYEVDSLFLKQGNFNHLKEALTWLRNILEAVKRGDEFHSHKDLFDRGREAADAVIRNCNSDQLF